MRKVQNSASAIITLLLLLVACTERPKNMSVEVRNLTVRQTGFIIEISPGQELLLEENFSGSLRVIDGAKGIYEILPPFTEADIEKVLPKAEVTKNMVILPELSPEKISAKQVAYAQMAAIPESKLKPCVSAREPPKSEISVLNESELKGKAGSINRGQVLRLSAQLSEPHPQHPGKLNFAWKILFPNEQIPQGPFSYDTNFDVQLSELGVYSIGLVAQDSRGVCALSVVEVGVKNNPQLVRNANPNLLPLSKLDGDFGHVRALNAEKAWTISQGKGQKIAIIDTGVNYNHPYLSSNIAINDKELPGNNIDDDRNGLIDDVFGWDFVQEDALPYDDSGHGSHVAGLAAGKVFGIAQDAKILAIKGVMVDGITDLGLVISGIYYAADNGATVINLSLGGPASKDPQKDLIPLRKAFAYAESKGAVIVTASGNGARSANGSTVPINIDISLHLPAGLDILNNISVAATNAFGQLTSYSNFGIKSVKVAAPGGDDSKPVFSAKQDNSKGNLFFGASGTSMATPIVSGAIALARAANSEMSMKELNEILQKSGTTNPSLRGKVKSERILDVFALVNNAQNRLF